MKVRPAVLGLHIVAIAAFVLTQGCVTTESQGSGRGAGARHRGISKHEHKGKASSRTATEPYMAESVQATDSMNESPLIDEGSVIESPTPYVAPIAPSASSETYIVQPGDVLSKLAVRFDTTTKTLVSMNNLSNPDELYVGQELRVPSGSLSSGGYSSAPASHSSVKKGGEYTIQKGDTLSGIAVAAGLGLTDLRTLNNIKDDKIFDGKTIYIPSGGVVPTHTQKSPPKKTPEPVPEKKDPVVGEPSPLDPDVPPVGTGSDMVEVTEHVVYPGQTLAEIANDHGVSKSEIMRLNNISDESEIKVGQRLRIPISE